MDSSWRSTCNPASANLAGVLAGIWSVHAGSEAELSARVLPDGSICLVFHRDGTVLRSCDDAWRPWAPTCVSRPRRGPFDFDLNAGGDILIVRLRTAWYRIDPEDRVREDAREQAMPFPIMVVSIKGTAEDEVDGQWVTLPAGNTAFIPPFVSHRWWNETDEPAEAVLIMFGDEA